jgi:hypothetical protein
MRWHELAHNPRAITHLYDEMPPLEQIELIEVIIQRDGPKLICKMNFPRFADHRPERWNKDCNTVHVELEFWTISDLSIGGFTTTPMLNFSLEQAGDKLRVCAEGPGCKVQFHCETIFIQRVSGYIKTP